MINVYEWKVIVISYLSYLGDLKCFLYIFFNVEFKIFFGVLVLFWGLCIFILYFMYYDNCVSYCSVVVFEIIFFKYL